MSRSSFVWFALVFLLATAVGWACSAPPEAEAPLGVRQALCRPPEARPRFRLRDAFPGVGFERPVAVVRDGDVYFVAEQGGRIQRVSREGDGWASRTFIDLSGNLSEDPGGEGGLIGLALSPRFRTSGEVFVFYISKRDDYSSALSRLTSHDGGYTADVGAEEIVLALDRHGYRGHNGGHLEFGPDERLYVGIGDSAWGDPTKAAQNPDELLGKLLRIDVLGARPYRSPSDNPFASGGGRPEVYALGFRNPWSFSFDPEGRLWLGDVGHERWEEIDLVVKGGNYGWPLREGTHCFQSSPCDDPGLIDPIHEYPHVDGLSVTGGRVYRGSKLALERSYVFGDFMTGRIWALDVAGTAPSRLLLDSGLYISGFSEDSDGELLVIDYSGHVMRLDSGEAGSSEVGVSLRQLGCLDGVSGAVAPAFVPYEVNAPFWSDGLEKRRWFYLPPNERIRAGDEHWQLPPGTMLLKEFALGGRRIETRLLVNDAEVGWLGYAFEWNADGSDAQLIDDAKIVDLDGAQWTIPSRAQCFGCHRKSAGSVLGFEASQLNRSQDGVNQLERLAQMGLLDLAVEPALAPSLANPYEEGIDTAGRARAWLHVNCSPCHRASGPGLIDFRAFVSVGDMNIVCREGSDADTGIHALLNPGEPETSALVMRVGTTDERRMPPLGTTHVDEVGLRVVSDWVRSMGGCL